MLIYEVNLTVERAIADQYLEWLEPHMQEMERFDGFGAASAYRVADPAAKPDQVVLCVQYRVASREALEDYLSNHAQRMREDGIRRFGDSFSAARRVLEPLQ